MSSSAGEEYRPPLVLTFIFLSFTFSLVLLLVTQCFTDLTEPKDEVELITTKDIKDE